MSIRPVFRVASAGLDPRDVRLIGIVFQHSQYNKYDFRMLDGLDLAGIDILIANPVDPRGLDAIASLPGAARRIPSLSAVPRGAQATARYSVTIDRLTLQLLPTLNRLVEEERLQPAVMPEAAPADGCRVLAAPASEVPAPPSPILAAIEATAAAGGVAAPDAVAAGAVAAPAEVPVLLQDAHDVAASASLATVPAEPAMSILPPLGRSRVSAALATPLLVQHDAACLGGDEMPADGAASMAAANAIVLAARRGVDDPVAPMTAPADFGWHGWAQQAPARARLQVLIADPSPAAQQQLVRALVRMGLEVHCVSGVAAALQRIAARYTDLVITESGLSDGDGFELIRRMRAQSAYRYTPVLLLRSRLHVMDATRARLAGEVTVLAKPLTRQALEALVRQVLRKSVILDDLSELLAPR